MAKKPLRPVSVVQGNLEALLNKFDKPQLVKEVCAFVGVQGSGKGYFCDTLIKEFNYTKLSYADPLREMCFHIIGMSFEDGMKQYTELKSTELFNGLTFRNILENTGSAIRKFDENFFANAMIAKIKEARTNVCIDDLRYVNEYTVLKDYCDENKIKLTVTMCDYHSDRYDSNNNHASAQLAKYLLELGYKHGQKVDDSAIRTFGRKY